MNINDFPVAVQPMIQTIVDMQRLDAEDYVAELYDFAKALRDGWEQPIKPGDTVAQYESGEEWHAATVLCVDGNKAWIKATTGERETFLLADLVRIDPT